ncbi:type II CRISPR-associated endonuclease Cas1 [Parafrigoribacterium humi]|uniref:type II CRISPR-associated endonuclease Cas1 n=1 Tax=Parafrigoribacterium humi TaxID=3144664 RepID=UPI0032EB1004
MIGRVIEVIESDRHLSLEYGNMLIRDSVRVVARVALDDVSAVIVNPYGATQSAGLLAALAERNIPFIVAGKNFSPVGIMLAIDGNFAQSGRIEKQIEASRPTTKRLWQQVVRAKLDMQSMALEVMGVDSSPVRAMIPRVRSGDPENFEAQAARLYWRRMFGRTFRRDRELMGVNSFLNYGYAVLRSATARAVVAAGLHPGIGIHHRNAYDSMRLVDDLMEPYRPLVDIRVHGLVDAGYEEVTVEVKRRLVSVINTDVPTSLGTSPVSVALHYLATSLSQVYSGDRDQLELPTSRMIDEVRDLAEVAA